MDFRTPEGPQRYADLVASARQGVICLDYDGVLAPIVEDPAAAYIHPEAAELLPRLAAAFRAVAVVTGRPAQQALDLGRLDAVADRVTGAEGTLLVLGQYGNERWSSADRRVISPPPPPGLEALAAELPELLALAGCPDAFVEDKGLAYAVHTRRLPDPAAALEKLTPVLTEAAERHDLAVEPGRMVVEVRAAGMTKGDAVRTLHQELGAEALMFTGDDLGDVQAFRAVAELRDGGVVGLLVCSGSEEQQALVELADLVVAGPDGVMELLGRLADDAGG